MALLKMVKMANLCLSACCRKCFPSGRKTGRRDPDYTKMADGGVVPPDVEDAEKRACSSSKREARTIIYFTRKLHILYTRSCNFWLASYPQIARSKRSSGSDFPSCLDILATISKTAVCLLPHQMEQVLRSTPV